MSTTIIVSSQHLDSFFFWEENVSGRIKHSIERNSITVKVQDMKHEPAAAVPCPPVALGTGRRGESATHGHPSILLSLACTAAIPGPLVKLVVSYYFARYSHKGKKAKGAMLCLLFCTVAPIFGNHQKRKKSKS